MNFSLFLFILSILHLVFCSERNITHDDSCNVCTLSFFRRKRALTEYTRWRANPETQEFIVKVLEDDTPSPQTKQIAAVNIQPFTKAQEKIIIGGAFLPSTNKESDLDSDKEYTRFVPPTTLEVVKVDGNIILAPIRQIDDVIPPIRPNGPVNKHSDIRNLPYDNSFLANTQDLERPQTLVMARQYAPIAPVSFTRRNTVGPLTPRIVDRFILHKTTIRPTRTSLLSSMPIRTSQYDNILLHKSISGIFNKLPATRSTLSELDLKRTSFIEESISPLEDENILSTINYAYNRKNNIDMKSQSNKDIEKDVDSSYNDLFYNDDDNWVTTKKHKLSLTEDVEEATNRTRVDDMNSEDNFNATDTSNESEDSSNNTETDQTHSNYEDDDDIENTTQTCTVGSSVENEKIKSISKAPKIKKDKRKLVCSVLKVRQLAFSTPLTLHEIVTQLKQWAEESPVAKWIDITNNNYTVMENPIYMMIVDDPSSGQILSAKQTVMIVAGIQGRDHHAVTAAMYLLYQLIERSEAHSDLLTKFRFWIIPVFNPDGYEYSMTFTHRREWTKNLRQTWDSCKGRESCQACEEFGIRCTIQPCYGVNLDRNFEYQWIPAEELKAEHPCGSLYAGPRQLSEVETKALTHFLHEQRLPLHSFIAFKEGDVLGVMYPYSHTRKRRAFDNVYRKRASRAASAAYSISGRPYVAGQTSEFLPLYAGGIEDWVDGHLGIDNTYTVMMFRPTDSQNSKLVMERVVHEAYAAVDTLLLQSVEPLGPPPLTLTKAKGSFSLLPSKILIVLINLMTLGYG